MIVSLLAQIQRIIGRFMIRLDCGLIVTSAEQLQSTWGLLQQYLIGVYFSGNMGVASINAAVASCVNISRWTKHFGKALKAGQISFVQRKS